MLDDTELKANISKRLTISELIEKYEAQRASMDDVIANFEAAARAVSAACSIHGKVWGSPWRDRSASPCKKTMEANLLRAAWEAVIDGLNIKEVATAKDIAKMNLALENPPEFTRDNISATFGDYLLDPRQNLLRGVAEAFADLDPAFKSHSKVKIGVKGLPKRIIITSLNRTSTKDILNALRALDGKEKLKSKEYEVIVEAAKGFRTHISTVESKVKSALKYGYAHLPADIQESLVEVALNPETRKTWAGHEAAIDACQGYFVRDSYGHNFFSFKTAAMKGIIPVVDGVKIKIFDNGNTHLQFDTAALRAVNKALAEFYGDTIAADVDPDPDMEKEPSREVAAKLQYYPSPMGVTQELTRDLQHYLEASYDHKEDRWDRKKISILEPSCGCGRILDAVKDRAASVDPVRRHVLAMVGIEYDPDRANEARSKGYPVQTANFLMVKAAPIFDFVIMNPPFHGKHWRKHILHALEFLKPGGELRAVLPATAWYDDPWLEKLSGWEEPENGWRGDCPWKDLPVASFRESGTNVPTGIITLRKAS